MGDVFDALVRAGQRQAKPLPGTRSNGSTNGEAASAAEFSGSTDETPAAEAASPGALPWSAADAAVAKQGEIDAQAMSMPLGEVSDADLDESEPPPPPPITRATTPPVTIPKDLPVPRPRSRPASPVAAAPAREPAPRNPPPSAGELARQQMLLQQYRSVRDALAQRGTAKGWKLHLFTCATGKDGRAATLFNLGQAFSERPDLRVLLLEAELRSPSFHRLFQKSFMPGLAQLLRGQLPTIDAAIHRTKHENLDVLPAGDCEFTTNRELLSGQAMLSLLQELKARYDHVLIDAPSVSLDDGASELASFADETLLVVRMRSTPTEQVEQAKRLLRTAGVGVTGVIVSHG